MKSSFTKYSKSLAGSYENFNFENQLSVNVWTGGLLWSDNKSRSVGVINMRNRPTKIEFEKKLDEVVCVIRDAIINHFYELGSFLPSEKQLAKQFNMSNNSIRKALEL